LGRPRQSLRRTLLKQHSYCAPLGTYLGKAELGSTFASDYHQIDTGRDQAGRRAKAFAAESLHPVPSYRPTNPSRDDDSQAGRAYGRRLGGHEEREVGGSDASSRALGLHELAVFPEPALAPRTSRSTGSLVRAALTLVAHGHRIPDYFL
jgi:hypothetical protein